jgi:hypothetical protein
MDKLYNMLDGLKADDICDAIQARELCAGMKCKECPFSSEDTLKNELKGMEE